MGETGAALEWRLGVHLVLPSALRGLPKFPRGMDLIWPPSPCFIGKETRLWRVGN